MSQSNISIRIDENLKNQFDKMCEELGLTMSSALNVFIKTVVREKRIPFELAAHVPNEETRKAIEEVEQGIGLSKPYTDIDEMFRDLLEEDDA